MKTHGFLSHIRSLLSMVKLYSNVCLCMHDPLQRGVTFYCSVFYVFYEQYLTIKVDVVISLAISLSMS